MVLGELVPAMDPPIRGLVGAPRFGGVTLALPV